GTARLDEGVDLLLGLVHRQVVDGAAHHLDAAVHASSRPRSATMRSAALPSHRGGRRARLLRPSSILNASSFTFSGSVPATMLVPSSTVIGRSVFSRTVMHGTPSAVVSSCRPPLSVSTNFASFQRLRKSI